MIISNLTNGLIAYNVRDQSGAFNDGGTLTANSYVEFQPRGQSPFFVASGTLSITLTAVPSPAIVTFWRSPSNQTGGGFSQ